MSDFDPTKRADGKWTVKAWAGECIDVYLGRCWDAANDGKLPLVCEFNDREYVLYTVNPRLMLCDLLCHQMPVGYYRPRAGQ